MSGGLIEHAPALPCTGSPALEGLHTADIGWRDGSVLVCGMFAECGIQNVECGMRNVVCTMRLHNVGLV